MLGFPADWKERLVQAVIDNHLIDRRDTHDGNIGFRGNQPVFFDA